MDVQQLSGEALSEAVAEIVLGWRRLEGAAAVDFAANSGRSPILHLGEGNIVEENQCIWVDAQNQVRACKHCNNMPDFAGDMNEALRAADEVRIVRLEMISSHLPKRIFDAWVHLPKIKGHGSGETRSEAFCRGLIAAAQQRTPQAS